MLPVKTPLPSQGLLRELTKIVLDLLVARFDALSADDQQLAVALARKAGNVAACLELSEPAALDYYRWILVSAADLGIANSEDVARMRALVLQEQADEVRVLAFIHGGEDAIRQMQTRKREQEAFDPSSAEVETSQRVRTPRARLRSRRVLADLSQGRVDPHADDRGAEGLT